MTSRKDRTAGSRSLLRASGAFETAGVVVFAVLIALGVRTVGYEPFSIPSGSMKPTLLVGDYLFVSKFSYGYSRHSIPFSPNLFSGRILFTAPERGDVAVFKFPVPGPSYGQNYIKRLVGLPGDTIQVVRGILRINGVPVERERIGDYDLFEEVVQSRSVPLYIETLPNGRRHQLIEAEGDISGADNTGQFVVPAGHYFAMGDNRDNSLDSRFGSRGRRGWFVPADHLVGRAEFLFFSKRNDDWIWKFWKWRPDRIFNTIE